MKEKIISILILIIMVISILGSFSNEVVAYSGEIDPKNYITLPSLISIRDKIGTGTIRLSSSASGYTISYQKVDITKAELDSISAKVKEIKEYTKTSNETIKEKGDNLTNLKKEYEKLNSSGTATEEQLSEAREKYNTAYAEYKQFYNTVKTTTETKQKEYLAMIPSYTNSWKTTTNTSNNVELDFSNYTGVVYFILWVKIDNGTDTYYDFNGYSSEIKGETTDDSSKGDSTDGEWTDFSKAKFELKKGGMFKATVQISGVTPKEDRTYYLYITSNNSKPNVSGGISNDKITLNYDKNSKTFKVSEMNKVAYYVELNQDLYASVVEKSGLTYNVVTYGNKLERFSEAKYSDAFHSSLMTYKLDQIVTTFTHDSKNNRKIQIKVGKITDQSILTKIKNKDSSGFSGLMTYAKSNSGIYNQTLDADKDDNYSIEYNAGGAKTTGNSVIDLKGLENGEYYYLYIKTDDENGKYISNEAVTLATASVINNEEWYMFFYGADDFKWADFGTVSGDNTMASGILPKTGTSYIMITIAGVVIAGGIVAYKKYKKYNF